MQLQPARLTIQIHMHLCSSGINNITTITIALFKRINE